MYVVMSYGKLLITMLVAIDTLPVARIEPVSCRDVSHVGSNVIWQVVDHHVGSYR